MEKNSYERCVYESVDDKSFSFVISQKVREQRVRKDRSIQMGPHRWGTNAYNYLFTTDELCKGGILSSFWNTQYAYKPLNVVSKIILEINL